MDLTDTKRFMVAGNATITVRANVSQVRYTFKISKADFAANTYFVGLLSGADNTADYAYMGLLMTGDNGAGPWYTRLTQKSKVSLDSTAWRAFNWFMRGVEHGTEEALMACEWWHEGACGACGRKLTVPESIEQGLGPVCAGRA